MKVCARVLRPFIHFFKEGGLRGHCSVTWGTIFIFLLLQNLLSNVFYFRATFNLSFHFHEIKKTRRIVISHPLRLAS